jgi:integrase
MIERPLIEEYSYYGVLADLCVSFVAEKRAVGLSFNIESRKMREFSRFSEKFNIPEMTLPEEVVKQWIEKRPNEASNNRYKRFSLIKNFAEYMQRLGYAAYIPSIDDISKHRREFVPYIFTHEEIRRFFLAVDNMKLSTATTSPRRHLIMPVLFRMLYCCGLRVSEASSLRSSDVDLKEGILIIHDSKFGRTRYVPMSAEITVICNDYAQTRLVAKQGTDWFFPAPDGGRYSEGTIYCIFRELLRKSDISHGGRGKGPRLHDFRHTFCVHCLQKWVKEGAELTTALPRLTAYLGHINFQTTEQYLRLTAEVYPEITNLMQDKYGYVIPKAGDSL